MTPTDFCWWSNRDIQRVAIDHQIRVMVVTGGLRVSHAIRDLALSKGVSILRSEHDSTTPPCFAEQLSR